MSDSIMKGIIHFLLELDLDHISIMKRSKEKLDLNRIENNLEIKIVIHTNTDIDLI